MSYTTPDFADDTINLLRAEGYQVNSDGVGPGAPGTMHETYWFTLTIVDEDDVYEVVGDPYDSLLAAWMGALQHRLTHSNLEVETDDTGV